MKAIFMRFGSRRVVSTGFAVVGALALGAFGVRGVLAQQQNFDNVQLHILPVQGSISMIVGDGGNITVQVGKEGVLVVDAGFAPLVPKLSAAIKTLSDKPLRYIINTHFHGDHTGGNEALAKTGAIIAGGNFAGSTPDIGNIATIVAHENVETRMSEQKPPPSNDALPRDLYHTASKDMYFNGEGIQIIHIPDAHTDGDSFVYFRKSDVLAVGDIFTPQNYPIVDIDHGGNINGLIAGLNKIIEITIPADKQEGGTYVIPGHGRLCDEADVVEYRDMATIIRDRVQDMVKKGMTLEQVRAAKPTRDYDPLYGATTGFWTTDKFVDAVYASLTKKK
jgi:cyclase